jgi:hypothetical protein
MVDLAVPRDIEPRSARLRDVYLYTSTTCRRSVQTAARSGRRRRAGRGHHRDRACRASCTGWTSAARCRLIQALNAQADDWRAAEIARARKLLGQGEDVEAVLEALSRGLTQKMLHGALAELHAADGEQRRSWRRRCRACSCATPRATRRRPAVATPRHRGGERVATRPAPPEPPHERIPPPAIRTPRDAAGELDATLADPQSPPT